MVKEILEYHDIIFEANVGKNAQENWDLISNASQNDIWFHLGSGMPSPHVILKIPNNFSLKKIPKQVIYWCANLCKSNSKYSDIKKVTVIYTEIKNVSKGNTIGSVYTKKTSDLKI